MARKMRIRSVLTGDHQSGSESSSLDGGDHLKNVVRDGLISMKAGRIEFIQALETEMRRSNLSISSYLIPLGIIASTPEELTPTEIGHLVRFLKIIVPHAMPAVERTMVRFEVFADRVNNFGDRLVA